MRRKTNLEGEKERKVIDPRRGGMRKKGRRRWITPVEASVCVCE